MQNKENVYDSMGDYYREVLAIMDKGRSKGSCMIISLATGPSKNNGKKQLGNVRRKGD
jgi:hypothetical protein